MAVTAVQVHGAGSFAVTGICGRVRIRIRARARPGTVAGVRASVMLVVVVAKVVCPDLGLVPAVRRDGRPAELERQEGEQDDSEEATHGRESSGYRVYLATTEAIEA